jgi:hypothetical protein
MASTIIREYMRIHGLTTRNDFYPSECKAVILTLTFRSVPDLATALVIMGDHPKQGLYFKKRINFITYYQLFNLSLLRSDPFHFFPCPNLISNLSVCLMFNGLLLMSQPALCLVGNQNCCSNNLTSLQSGIVAAVS